MAKINIGAAYKRYNDKIPARVVVAIMAFFASLSLYMLRVNISVTIIAMVEPPESRRNNTQDYGPRFDWSESVQGDVLAAFSYGYFITQFPGGLIAEIFGARWVVFSCAVVMAIFTIATPFAAMWHWGAVMFVRLMTGLAGGAIYPALHGAISRWAPPQEKSKFVWSLLGGTFGSMVTFPLVGALVPAIGWPASFYVCGGLVLLCSIVWILVIYDCPDKHPRITEKEKNYIHGEIGEHVQDVGMKKLPILSILSSIPFIALLFSHFANLWGLYFLLTLSPKFMSDILNFDLTASGGLSSLPHLARLLFGIVFSSIGDKLVKTEKMERTTIRKVFTVFSHIIPGALLLSIGFLGDQVALIITAMTLSLGFNGAASVTNLANHHDLAPNHAGSLYGIMNGVGATTGFIIPAVSGRILETNNTIYEWRIIFMIGAIAYFVGGIIFIIFGSGKMQSWNFPGEKQGTQKGALKAQEAQQGAVAEKSEDTKI